MQSAVRMFPFFCLILEILHDLPKLFRTQLIQLSPDMVMVKIPHKTEIRLIGHGIQTVAHLEITENFQICGIVKYGIIFMGI